VWIDPKTITGKNERVSLVFEIKEGAKLAVSQVQFTGNTALPGKQA
jgi:outer membrane protein assembly factor BamA